MTLILKTDNLSISPEDQRGYSNRKRWKRGVQGCGRCIRKIMAYLEDGHGLEDVAREMKKNHPEYVYIRKSAMDAIRRVTGWGIYDDYILEHDLWKLRKPILCPPEDRPALEETWKQYAKEGRDLIEMDTKLKELHEDPEMEKLIKYAQRKVL